MVERKFDPSLVWLEASPPGPAWLGAEGGDLLAELSLEHGTFLRLEQERLPSPFILDQLCRAMEGNGLACLRPARKSEPPPPV
jgi:hypothetical protein